MTEISRYLKDNIFIPNDMNTTKPSISGWCKGGNIVKERCLTYKEAQQWVDNGGNVAIACTDGFLVLDIEKPWVVELAEGIIPTPTYRESTPSVGEHWVFKNTEISENIKVSVGKGPGEETFLEVIVRGHQCHVAPSKKPSKQDGVIRPYEVKTDLPIAEIETSKIHALVAAVKEMVGIGANVSNRTGYDAVEVAEECFIGYGDLLRYEPPKENWLIENQIPREVVVVVAGRGDSFKSLTTLYQSVCLAAGHTCFEDKVLQAGRVVYIDEENGKPGLAKRVKMIARGLKLDVQELPILFVTGSSLKLDGLSQRNNRNSAIVQRITEFKPDLLVIDCLQRVVSLDVDRENYLISSLFTDTLRPIQRATGCTVLLIHHLRKPSKGEVGDTLDQLRGGSELRNYARVIALLDAPQAKRTGDAVVVNMSIEKLSDGTRPPAKSILWTFTDDSVTVDVLGEPEKVLSREALAAERIKAWIVREGKLKFKRTDLKVLDLGAGRSSLSGALNYLVLTEQYLVREGGGWYVVRPCKTLEDFEVKESLPDGGIAKLCAIHRQNAEGQLLELKRWAELAFKDGITEGEFNELFHKGLERGNWWSPRNDDKYILSSKAEAGGAP